MGNVCVILLIGKCYGLFEIKYILLANFLLFEIGNVVCGAAQNMNAIIVGRVISGVGGAGCFLGLVHRFASAWSAVSDYSKELSTTSPCSQP